MSRVSTLLVLSLTVLGVTSRAADDRRWAFRRFSDTCLVDGVKYKVGDDVPSTDICVACRCSEGGRVTCVSELCMVPMCVDYNRHPKVCCPSCPNGSNCWLNGEKIPAGQKKTIPSPNDSYCWKQCACPGASAYLKQGTRTQAVCDPNDICA